MKPISEVNEYITWLTHRQAGVMNTVRVWHETNGIGSASKYSQKVMKISMAQGTQWTLELRKSPETNGFTKTTNS